jgi:hypothetical protein
MNRDTKKTKRLALAKQTLRTLDIELEKVEAGRKPGQTCYSDAEVSCCAQF